MVEINLLPTQYRKRSESGLWRYGTLALPVVTVLGIAVFSLVQNSRLGNLQAQLADNTGQIAGLESAKREYDDLTRQKSDLQKVTEVSGALQANKTYWSSDLARFVNALPSSGGVALTNMTVRAVDSNAQSNLSQQGLYNGKAVSKEFDLNGQAVSSQALVNFLNSFENNPNFGVNFKSASRDATTATNPKATAPYTFSATVGLVGQAKTTAETTAPAAGSTPAAGGSDVR